MTQQAAPSAASVIPSSSAPSSIIRVRVFVDYWNFQLTMNRMEDTRLETQDTRFKLDWKGLGGWLAKKACQEVALPHFSFEGIIIYASYNPNTSEGKAFKSWATTWLNRQPGIRVECFERKPKALPICPVCHSQIKNCPHCTKPIVATVEKGVDTLIATDMIRLAWENAYDLAVIASSDSDLVPAVEFLNSKGRKVVQAGFPPMGVDLATACWASFDVYRHREEIRRP